VATVSGDSDKRTKKGGGRKRTKNKYWTRCEMELLYRGVQQHRAGNWAAIGSKVKGLRGRTRVDIKGKWRRMIRGGQLDKLACQFGQL